MADTLSLDSQVPFEFEFTYSAGEPQEWEYPGSGPEIEITKVMLNGIEIPLAAITDDILENMVRHVNDNY